MAQGSVNSKPSYETQPIVGKLLSLAFLVYTPIFAVLGVYGLVRGLSASTPLSSMEILAGSVSLGGSILLPLAMRWKSKKSKENCVEFINSTSDLIKYWTLVYRDPLSYVAFCELSDSLYLELAAPSSDVFSLIIYRFLTPPQNVKKTPLWRTGKPDKRILPFKFLPYVKVPLKTEGLQKWKEHPDKWKRLIAEDEELCELIVKYSGEASLLSTFSPSKGIRLIYVAGYDTNFIHPLSKGYSLRGKSLGVGIIFQKKKMVTEKFETPPILNKQLINVGVRILKHLAAGK